MAKPKKKKLLEVKQPEPIKVEEIGTTPQIIISVPERKNILQRLRDRRNK